MEYSILGRTGQKVSKIGFGGAVAMKNYIKSYDNSVKEERDNIIAAIQKAYELGINYFDTARGYGESEDIFGEAFQGIDRNQLFIATKVSKSDSDPSSVRESVETSLKKMNLDCIDLVQIHGSTYSEEDYEVAMKIDGILEQLEKLKSEGLLKYIGFSVETQNEPLYQFIKSGRFDAVQMCYNFMYQHPYDPFFKAGSFFDANKADIGIVTMRSTTSGIFQKWIQLVNPQNTFDYTTALIQYQLSNPLLNVALIGMRTPERVIQNVEICKDVSNRIDFEKLHTFSSEQL